MSYILEALKRAEAERERGRVPGLQSRPLAADAPAAGPSRQHAPRLRPWLWAAGGAGLALLLGALAAAFWPGRPVPPPQHQQPVVALTPPPVPPAPQPAPGPELKRLQGPAPDPLPAPVVAPAPAPVPAPAAPVAATPPLLKDLPEALRRELPALAVGGAMYSDQPAARMLILNGQVFREGDRVAPELVLEQIELKRARLVYKGQQRFLIGY